MIRNAFFALTAAVIFVSAAIAQEPAETPTEPAAEAPTPKSKPKPVKPGSYTILKLNSEDIKSTEAEEMWKNLFAGATVPDFNTFDEKVRQRLLSSMVIERLIYQEALKEGYEKSDEVKKRLANLQRQVILQSYMEKKGKDLVTEQQLKEAYAKKVAVLRNEEEIRARHILVPTEEEAKEIVKRLKKGEDFEKLAKEKSKDAGSAAKGGELDYFTKERMVPEFSTAAFKLKAGEVSEPVKTSFGWHIIKVEDRRKVRIPSLEEIKDELANELSAGAMKTYLEGLLKHADIKYYTPEGKERDFPRSLQTK